MNKNTLRILNYFMPFICLIFIFGGLFIGAYYKLYFLGAGSALLGSFLAFIMHILNKKRGDEIRKELGKKL